MASSSAPTIALYDSKKTIASVGIFKEKSKTPVIGIEFKGDGTATTTKEESMASHFLLGTHELDAAMHSFRIALTTALFPHLLQELKQGTHPRILHFLMEQALRSSDKRRLGPEHNPFPINSTSQYCEVQNVLLDLIIAIRQFSSPYSTTKSGPFNLSDAISFMADLAKELDFQVKIQIGSLKNAIDDVVKGYELPTDQSSSEFAAKCVTTLTEQRFVASSIGETLTIGSSSENKCLRLLAEVSRGDFYWDPILEKDQIDLETGKFLTQPYSEEQINEMKNSLRDFIKIQLTAYSKVASSKDHKKFANLILDTIEIHPDFDPVKIADRLVQNLIDYHKKEPKEGKYDTFINGIKNNSTYLCLKAEATLLADLANRKERLDRATPPAYDRLPGALPPLYYYSDDEAAPAVRPPGSPRFFSSSGVSPGSGIEPATVFSKGPA